MVVREPGDNVVPLYSRSRPSQLAAEAATWPRLYLRPAFHAGTIDDRDMSDFGLWLSARTGMTGESLNAILTARAEASPKTEAAYRRMFWRRVNRCVRVIKLGLVLAGQYVHPVPEAEKSGKKLRP
jgi:hypothetical protein